MIYKAIFTVITALGAVLATSGADATTTFDANVTNNVIFSSGGVSNGAFTVDRANGVELGLRGKLRFNSANLPENTFNSNGDGTYSFQGGAAPDGFGFDSGSLTTPVWSFEWSINSDWDGSGSGRKLDGLSYLLEIDGDPTATNNGAGIGFDPINLGPADHAIGNNLTGNGGGAIAANPTDYALLIANNNLAQNSWNYEFFNETTDGLYLSQLAGFDPYVAGIYTIKLSAFDGNQAMLASTSIDILVSAVPIPAALPLFLSGLFGLGVVARRKRKQVAIT